MSDTKQGVCGHWNVSCKVRERLGRAVTRRDCLVWQLQQSDPLNPETDVVALLPSLPLGVCKADWHEPKYNVSMYHSQVCCLACSWSETVKWQLRTSSIAIQSSDPHSRVTMCYTSYLHNNSIQPIRWSSKWTWHYYYMEVNVSFLFMNAVEFPKFDLKTIMIRILLLGLTADYWVLCKHVTGQSIQHWPQHWAVVKQSEHTVHPGYNGMACHHLKLSIAGETCFFLPVKISFIK